MNHVLTKRARDKAVILAVVRRFGPVSRVDIHRLTRLRPSTISLLVRELLVEGKLLEAGPSDNPTGRKQVLLRVNEQFGCIAGIEFDAEYVVAAVMDLHPSILAEVKEPVRLDGGVDGLVGQLFGAVRAALEQAGVDRGTLLGIGIADPGLIHSREGVSVICSNIDFWRDVPLGRMFEDEFGVECLLESNTRARAVAERFAGAGEMADDMVYVDYGAGVGAGIFTGGRILRGHRESAGEFGHTHVSEGGAACSCGSFGCLEATVGAPALASRVRRAIEAGSSSLALELAGSDARKITGWTVLEAARLGDKMSGAVTEDLGNYLGLGLANLVNLVNPALVVLDRRLELAGPGLLEQIARIVRRQALRHSTDQLEFRYGKLGSEAGVLGAGLLVLEKLFEIPALKPPRFLIDPVGAKAAPRVARTPV